MKKLQIASFARTDLRAILEYLTERNPVAAQKFLKKLNDSFNFLLQFPDSGRLRHELLINLRSVVVGQYVVFYQSLADNLEILRVLHGSRDARRAFAEMTGTEMPEE